jgi:DNA invertase Pin-like site-specific DNA recombinase
MIYGYVRVSTSKKDDKGEFVQTFDLQRDALIDRGGVQPENIYEDRISGAAESRPGLDALLSVVVEGDSIVVWKLDRLGRNARHLLQIAEDLKERGVALRSVIDGIDTTGSMGGFVLKILAAVAELERETISERVTAGIAASVRSGGRIGRFPALSPYQSKEVARRLGAGESATQIARDFRISRQAVYNISKRMAGGV